MPILEGIVEKILIAGASVLVISLLTLTVKQYFEIESLEDRNRDNVVTIGNLKTAVKEYDQIVEVIPYNVLNKYKGGETDEEIHAIHNDGDLIVGDQWM